MAVPVATNLIVLAIVRAVTDGRRHVDPWPIVVRVVLLFLSTVVANVVPLAVVVLLMGILGASLLATYVYRSSHAVDLDQVLA